VTASVKGVRAPLSQPPPSWRSGRQAICSLFLALGLPLAAVATDASIYQDGWNDLNKNGRKDVFEDPARPVEKRISDLLHRMTLREKIGQLTQADCMSDAITRYTNRLPVGGIGSFLDGSGDLETPALRNRLQHIVVEQSRLGIPLILGHDAIHGFRTLYPIPLALACAWEPELFERTQAISARECAAVGIDWTFSPMVDLARDPRWGRIAEGFGEDPWLGCLYGAASVRGFQGTNIAAPGRVAACLKHYVGYGAAEGGRDYNTTEISEYTLRNFYLPQFKAGVDAGAWTIMSAFNGLSGVPSSGNYHTLTEILRHEWKFQGFVVSDWSAVLQLIQHGAAIDAASAARLGLTAGVDMEMVSTTYYDTLEQQVNDGRIPRKVIDEAVRRILRVKFVKGLFEHPYADETLCQNAFLRPDALALSREAAAKSCVLLKNDGGLLPLSRDVKSVALIGPLASDAEEMVGCWYSRAHAEGLVSLETGLRAKLPAACQLSVVRGCSIIESGKPRYHVRDYRQVQEKILPGRQEIDEAVAAARAADTVILALGEPRDWSGEDDSRSDLNVTGRQMELFEAVAALGKPVIVVLFNGRPLTLSRFQEKAAAILEAWQLGTEAGNGIADILFGDAEPTGRLTTSFPRNVGQLPVHYNHYNTGRPELGNYVDGPRDPLYPFGFGLGYTTFGFSPTKVETFPAAGAQTGSNAVAVFQAITSAPRFESPAPASASERSKACCFLNLSLASATVTNTGTRPGTEVVQFYIRALASSAGPRAVRELKGFQKVHLNPGESKTVSFLFSPRDLGCYDAQGRWVAAPGKFQVWLAPHSAAGQPADFEVKP
jgi:beta-glucosidase